jgi:hypothetical protein
VNGLGHAARKNIGLASLKRPPVDGPDMAGRRRLGRNPKTDCHKMLLLHASYRKRSEGVLVPTHYPARNAPECRQFYIIDQTVSQAMAEFAIADEQTLRRQAWRAWMAKQSS